jgi:histidinol-phosphate/aromatic aminotransferase/cobyric acid decarboxylase-like protein
VKSTQNRQLPTTAKTNRAGCDSVVDLHHPCDPSWLGHVTFELSNCLHGRSPADLALELRQRIAATNRIPLENVHLFESIDRMLVELLRGNPSPKVCFPPSASAAMVQCATRDADRVSLVRGLGSDGEIDVDAAIDLPVDGLVIVDSPSDPLGSILLPNDAVRLARACQLVVVDERYGEFSSFTLRGLASEFHNIAVLRSYERWLGPADAACGWAFASPELVDRFEMDSHDIDPAAMAAAITLLSDRQTTELAARLARQERSRLYRLLRKFSFLTPLPSWGPFMSARIDVVPRAAVVQAFLERNIRVHSPEGPGLEDFIRFSIGSRTAMEQVRLALIDMAPQLLG